MSIYLCVLFNQQREPLAAGLRANNSTHFWPLYAKGTTTIKVAESNIDEIKTIVTNLIINRKTIITSSFKDIANALKLEFMRGTDYPIYDTSIQTIVNPTTTSDEARNIINDILTELPKSEPTRWQRLVANAGIVYNDLEARGVEIGGMGYKPIWSQNTFSGRSKTLIVNIQGADGVPGMANPYCPTDCVYVYFDWVAADLRVASIMSNDTSMQESFVDSDPYTYLERILSTAGQVSRDDCKLQLLKAINSMDYSNPILQTIYDGLGKWLESISYNISINKCAESILGRRFYISDDGKRTPLSVLNGIFQGSVAHAMQHSIKRIWDIISLQLLVEIHDSICITMPKDELKATIPAVADIMCYPFQGILQSNPFFPVRVSIGEQFREWQPVRIYRENGIQKL